MLKIDGISMTHGPLIDTHQHPVPDYYKRALATVGITGSGENPWPEWSLEGQLELMDETGMTAVVNSVASPGAYFGDTDLAVRISRECGDLDLGKFARIARVVDVDECGAIRRCYMPDIGNPIPHHYLTAAWTVEIADDLEPLRNRHA